MSQRAFSTTRSAVSSQVVQRSNQVREVGLRLVGPVRVRARRAPFVVVILSVLATGLVGLILMSTVMQAQSFQIHDLQRQAALVEAQRAEMSAALDRLQSPSAVAERALAEGMVPNANPVFLRLSDGAVIGVPKPAEPGTNVRRVN